MRQYALLLYALWALSGCRKTAEFEPAHDPQIHLETVIYADEPMPDIEIKRSFVLRGNDRYEVSTDDLLVSGAEVTLRWNGVSAELDEIARGTYRLNRSDTVRMGDAIEIAVRYEQSLATATTTIPEYPINEVTASADISDYFSLSASFLGIDGKPVPNKRVFLNKENNLDTIRVWAINTNITVGLPFIPDYMALSVYDPLLLEYIRPPLQRELYEGEYIPPLIQYRRYLGNQLSGISDPKLNFWSILYLTDENPPEVGSRMVNCVVELVIPEPFYFGYYNIRSDFVVPITVTNVTGGVGIFIGAIRSKSILPVTIQIDEVRE